MQTEIVPVQVYPGTATRFYLRAGNLGPPPAYYYQLQSVTLIPPAPEQVDPTTGAVLTPAVSASEEVVVLKDGNANMTDAQWQNWPADLGTDGDDEYQLTAIAANLGLTRA